MSKTTVDCTPTWEFATRIYIAVLRNPDASFDALRAAEEELIRLARIVDHHAAAAKAATPPDEAP